MNKHWQEQLKKTWGIDASLTSLDGEFDLNFKASTQDGRRYLMKVMRAACDTGFVEMQCNVCLLYTSPSPRDATLSRMPSSA